MGKYKYLNGDIPMIERRAGAYEKPEPKPNYLTIFLFWFIAGALFWGVVHCW